MGVYIGVQHHAQNASFVRLAALRGNSITQFPRRANVIVHVPVVITFQLLKKEVSEMNLSFTKCFYFISFISF